MSISVLLVDDTAFLRAMLREILESSGSYRVVAEASDGVAALSLQPELRTDLVISDLIMPGLDGIEMTRALVGTDPSVRVVVTAADDQEGAVLEALAAGASDFLHKPYSARDVLRTLEEPSHLPDRTEAPEGDFRLRVALGASTPLPAPRLRVLLRRCRQLGTLLEASPMEAALRAGEGERSLEVILRTRHSAETLLEWIRKLPFVAGVSVEPVAAASEREAGSPARRPGGAPSRGTTRIRTALLDRLLDQLETSLAEQAHLAQAFSINASKSDDISSLRRLEKCLSGMRTEVLAARQVSFARVARKLERVVEEAGRKSSRRASLRITGEESLADLGVLEEVLLFLERLLPRVLETGVEQRDILRQLGKPECGVLELAVFRDSSALVLTLGVQDPVGKLPPGLLDEEIGEGFRRLGGTVGVVKDPAGWRIEMRVPAGVAVVRSYLCKAGGRLFAVPVGSVEGAIELDGGRIRLQQGRSVWEKEPGEVIPLVRFGGIPWVEAEGGSQQGFPALLYRVGPQRYALALDAVLGETDIVLRPSEGTAGSRETAGTALLLDGGVATVPDLPHLARVR